MALSDYAKRKILSAFRDPDVALELTTALEYADTQVDAGVVATTKISLTDHQNIGFTDSADTPSLVFTNDAIDYAQIITLDDVGPGDASATMRMLYISTGSKTHEDAVDATGSLEIYTGYNAGSGNSGVLAISTGWTEGTGNTGALNLRSGDAFGDGNSGAINIVTGDADGSGVRGIISLAARAIDASTTQEGIRMPSMAAAPTLENGMGGVIYFDTVLQQLCLRLTNNTWVSIDTTAV